MLNRSENFLLISYLQNYKLPNGETYKVIKFAKFKTITLLDDMRSCIFFSLGWALFPHASYFTDFDDMHLEVQSFAMLAAVMLPYFVN